MPLISVILTCYNKADFIQESINSVIKQTLKDWEMIIIDDASTDDSARMIDLMAKDSRIKLVSNETNKGANYSRNLGLRMSESEYVMFLDGDDLLINTCFESRCKTVQKDPGLDLYVFDMGVFIDKIGDDERVWQPRTKDPLKDFLSHNLPWAIMQPLWKKKFLLGINGFDEAFNRLQDVELSTRALLQKNISYALISGKADCYYRIKQARISSVYNLMKKWVDSCNMYCSKFEKLLPESKHKKYLYGTIVRTHVQLMHYYQRSNISKEEFLSLEKDLYTNILKLNTAQRILVSIIRFFKVNGLRVPGVNYFGIKLVIKLA